MTLPRGAVSNLRVLDLFRSAPGGARWVTNSVSRGIVYTRLFYLFFTRRPSKRKEMILPQTRPFQCLELLGVLPLPLPLPLPVAANHQDGGKREHWLTAGK